MRRLLCLAVLLSASTAALAAEPAKDPMLYELRIYTAEKGKLDALHARFKDHTLKLFEKHGITNIGYWVPIKNDENKLYYVIAHKDKAARDASFKAFGSDPDWQKAYKESEKDGPLTTKGGIEAIFLSATDYSPPVKAEKGKEDRVFEMRTYTCTKGNLDALNSRFRDHTLKLFEKHGMTNFAYFTYAPKLNKTGEDVTLLYFLAHKSEDDAKKSFDSFRADKDWIAAKEASEKKAGGSLTEKEGGVKSLFLKATDYSPTK
jgi:L-rhamnose mutarotase